MLNKIGQLLIGYLALSKAKKGTQAMVYILLEGEEQQLEMCQFISENKEASDDEILSMARKISKQN